jgi:hypothetical protein
VLFGCLAVGLWERVLLLLVVCTTPYIEKEHGYFWRMASSEMLRRVALIRTDVSEELSDYFIRVMAKVVPSSPILITLMMKALRSSDTSFLTRATRRNIPEGAILHSHCFENLKSYTALIGWTRSGDVMCLLWSTKCVLKFQKTPPWKPQILHSINRLGSVAET